MKSGLLLTLSMILVTSTATVTNASAQEVTRAQVRADLVRLEQAGYNPARGADPDYPVDIQAAEARVAAQDNASLSRDAVGGTQPNGSSAAGTRMQTSMRSSCVGPASFCNVYAGS